MSYQIPILRKEDLKSVWGDRIRTYECQFQKHLSDIKNRRWSLYFLVTLMDRDDD